MFTINQQPYINLEPYIDIEGLQKIQKNIILGIAKSMDKIADSGCRQHNLYPNEFQKNKLSLPSLSSRKTLEDPNNPNYEFYKELKFDMRKCKMFNRYAHDCLQMGQTLQLRAQADGEFQNKGLASACMETESYKNFPLLTKWINELTIFSSIGRIIFFFNAPNEPHAIHKDEYFGVPEQFVLININPYRKDFFIIDDQGNEIIVKSKACVFDPRNYHGTRGKDFYSWSLRIDGVFDKSWLEQANLSNHFK